MSSSNKVFGKFLIIVSGLEIISAIFINPWVGKFWRSAPLSHRLMAIPEAMFNYFVWAAVLGGVTLLGMLWMLTIQKIR